MQSTMEQPITAPPPAPTSTCPVCAPGAEPFTVDERVALHGEDAQAARAVAAIMIAIMTAALIGYTVIAFLAFAGNS